MTGIFNSYFSVDRLHLTQLKKSTIAPLCYPNTMVRHLVKLKIQNGDYYIHLIKTYKYLIEGSMADGISLFSAVLSDMIRSSGRKQKCKKLH